ncbi:IclR family transcriptional regulator [Pseudomonas sp.]|uniref:IclR family transcriptional regulator n=1 Tax=Pseudomonas sp. TaxID=306 RepID=UPI0031B57838
MAEDTTDDSGIVRAVVRAVNILQSFENSSGSMSVAEIQKKVALSRPTLYRLLDTLVSTGMLFAEGEPQRFRLGRGAARLGQMWAAQFDIQATAKPILDRLRDVTGETCGLFKLQDGHQYCIMESKSKHPLAMSRGIGELMDGFHGASGKAMLAWLPQDVAMPLLTASFDPSEINRIKDELANIVKNGFAMSHGAVFDGATSIAAPVFAEKNHVFGSLAIFGPDARLKEGTMSDAIDLVKSAAHDLSLQLGANA